MSDIRGGDHFIEKSTNQKYKDLFIAEKLPTLDRLGIYKIMYPENDMKNGIFQSEKTFTKDTLETIEEILKDLNDAIKELATLEDINLSRSILVKIITIDVNLLDIQINKIPFSEERSSIFNKRNYINNNEINAMGVETPKNLTVGKVRLSNNLSDYLKQVHFYLDLIKEISSFDEKAITPTPIKKYSASITALLQENSTLEILFNNGINKYTARTPNSIFGKNKHSLKSLTDNPSA